MFRHALVVLFVFLAFSAFAQNQPPQAQPQTIFTQNSEPIEIVLRGSDPEGGDLRFEIVDPPRLGSLSDPEAIVPPVETDPRTGEPFQPPVTSARVVYRADRPGSEDSFTFSVIDREGASGMATVTINPAPEPPPPPVETVIVDDTSGEVFRDTQQVLTLTGKAPEETSLTFRILSNPSKGELGELIQGSEKPQRTATIPYTPQREYLGGDAFEFEACGYVNGIYVCDAARYSIEVVERPQEPARLVSDVAVGTPRNVTKQFSLASDNRALVPGKPIVLRARIAGNVADSDDDGEGDNRNDLPGPEPLFMRAGVHQDGEEGSRGTARMHFEWDLGELEDVQNIVRADVTIRTLRRSEEGINTSFFSVGHDNDGELQLEDFQSDAEHIPGAVMPMPSLQQMPVGEEGTFTFDVLGELLAARAQGFRILSLQGRVDEKFEKPFAGLDVRTTAYENIDRQLDPSLTIETAHAPAALTYSVLSLPETGTLKDDLGNVIREVPYRLPNDKVVYTPATGFTGQVSFQFSATDGFTIDTARAVITMFHGLCHTDADFCFNGR